MSKAKIYIAGKITDFPAYKQKFSDKVIELKKKYGCAVLSPAILPLGFTHEEYMIICKAMISVCTHIYMLDNWQDSDGAGDDLEDALELGLLVEFE